MRMRRKTATGMRRKIVIGAHDHRSKQYTTLIGNDLDGFIITGAWLAALGMSNMVLLLQ